MFFKNKLTVIHDIFNVKLFSNFSTQELEEKLNEKDRDIIEKNKVIAALENQCKM
jgi:hypothetical protein